MGIDGFPNTDGENNKAYMLAQIVDSAESFSVTINKGENITLRFAGKYPVERPLLYPMLEKPMSLDELDAIIVNAMMESNGESARDFADFFVDTDMSDEPSALKRFGEFIESKKPKHIMVFLDATARWNAMLAALDDFNKAGFICEKEINPPDLSWGSRGSILLFLDEASTHLKTVVFDGNVKNALVKMILVADLTEFDMSVDQGFCNLVFYA